VQADDTGLFSVSSVYTIVSSDVSGTWKVTAYDSSAGRTAEYTFTATAAPDTMAPTLTVSIVPDKANYGLETITITVSADEVLTACVIHVTQQGASQETVASSASIGDNSKWGGTYTISAGNDGTAEIHVIGTDLSGNSGEATKTFAVSTGVVPPGLEDRIGDLESSVSSLESQVAGISVPDLSEIKSDIASLKSDIAALKAQPPPVAPSNMLVYGALIIGIIAIAIAAVSLVRKK
jgi:hypothetical protein